MAIKKFTMDEVDKEILQIIQQQSTGQVASTGKPKNVLEQLMEKAKAKRNGNSGTQN